MVGNTDRHICSGLSQQAEVLWDKLSRKHPCPPSYQRAGTRAQRSGDKHKHKRTPKVSLVEVGRSRAEVRGQQSSL